MLVAKEIERLRNVRAGYVLYRALVMKINDNSNPSSKELR